MFCFVDVNNNALKNLLLFCKIKKIFNIKINN